MWRVNCGLFQSVSAPSTDAAPAPPAPRPGQAAVRPFPEQLKLCRSQAEPKGPCVPHIRDLCSDHSSAGWGALLQLRGFPEIQEASTLVPSFLLFPLGARH